MADLAAPRRRPATTTTGSLARGMGGDLCAVGPALALVKGVGVRRRRLAAGGASRGAGWRCDDLCEYSGELCAVAARTPAQHNPRVCVPSFLR